MRRTRTSEPSRGFSEWLERCLAEAGLDPKEAAARAGITPSYLSMLKTGRRTRPSAEKVVSLASVLGADPGEALKAANLPPARDGARPGPGVEQVKQQRDQFYADISRTIGHCLGNWMGTLQANCNLLVRLHGVTGPLKRLQEAIRFLQHFSRIAGGLASIDRRPEFAQVTVREVLRRSIRLLADDRIQLVGSGEELIVEASEFHLQLVVAELLSNATRFARSSIEIWCTRSGPDYEIHVKDDGPGVVSRLKKGAAMFAPQTTTDEASHAGLGLSYVRRVANVHGGDVREIGEPGEGAHFVVRLPIHPPEEEQV